MKEKIEEAYIKIVGAPKPPDISFEELIKMKPLIQEDKHKEINIGQSATGYLKTCLQPTLTKVDNERLKTLLWVGWPHYNDYCINCMDVDLWMIEADFKKPIKAARQIVKLNPAYDVKRLAEDLKGAMTGTYGLSFLSSSKTFIILVDENVYKEDRKIQHEFTHYVVEVTGQLILDGDIKKEVRSFFGLNDQYVDYMLNEREFWVNIYNDLFNGLQKIYWLNFKNIYSWEQFIEYQFNLLKSMASEWTESSIRNLWEKFVKANAFYIRILAGISYVKPDFFDEIVEKLKNR